MTLTRVLRPLGLVAALALSAGCASKDDVIVKTGADKKEGVGEALKGLLPN